MQAHNEHGQEELVSDTHGIWREVIDTMLPEWTRNGGRARVSGALPTAILMRRTSKDTHEQFFSAERLM